MKVEDELVVLDNGLKMSLLCRRAAASNVNPVYQYFVPDFKRYFFSVMGKGKREMGMRMGMGLGTGMGKGMGMRMGMGMENGMRMGMGVGV